jgi:molecular chaperone DnaJ
MSKDYYTILGIDKTADGNAVKQAYRRLAMKYHPDRNAGNAASEERFKEVQEAYSVLSDDQKRRSYDQFGTEDPSAAAGGGGFEDIFGAFSDAFESVFSGGRGKRSSRSNKQGVPGNDLLYTLSLSLEDVYAGKQSEITYTTNVACSDCSGHGGKGQRACVGCGGSGQMLFQQGFFSFQKTCERCHGAGSTVDQPCRACKGEGRTSSERKLSVKIPPGLDEGDRVRLVGNGESGLKGGPSGDLYVEIRLKEHAIFKREHENLKFDLPISFSHAALGCSVNIPTLGETVALKIPAGTQTGKVFRIKGKGLPKVKSPSLYGDLMCHVVIETPVRLTNEQKELFTTLEQSLKHDQKYHTPNEESWLDKVKRFFDPSPL